MVPWVAEDLRLFDAGYNVGLRIWAGPQPPASDSQALHTYDSSQCKGKVVFDAAENVVTARGESDGGAVVGCVGPQCGLTPG